MKKFFISMALVAALIFPTIAKAEGGDGVYLLKACNTFIKLVENFEMADVNYENGFSFGYLTGLIKNYRFLSGFLKAETKSDKYCVLNENIELEQCIRIIHKYLKDHPEDLHRQDVSLVLVALTFACRNQN